MLKWYTLVVGMVMCALGVADARADIASTSYAEHIANKLKSTETIDPTSDDKYPSVKTMVNWATTNFVKQVGGVGDATQPIYIDATGKPTATTYTLGKSVPSDAVFTDTTYNAMTGATAGTSGTSGLVPRPVAGDQSKVLSGSGDWVQICTEGYISENNACIAVNNGNQIVIPRATTSVAGVVKFEAETDNSALGVVGGTIVTKSASNTQLGAVKVGDGLVMDDTTYKLSVDTSTGTTTASSVNGYVSKVRVGSTGTTFVDMYIE